MRILPTPTPLM